MAYSGSRNFILITNDIIKESAERAGIIDEEDDLTPAQYISYRRTLNILVAAWQVKGIYLWTVVWDQLQLTASSITLSGGVDYECIRNHTSSADTEPGVGTNWQSYWKLLSTTAGGAWVTATDYTSICNVSIPVDTLDINKMFIRVDGNDSEVKEFTRHDYFNKTDKYENTTNKPTKYWLDKHIEDASEIFLYPYPNDDTAVLHYGRVKRLQDFVTSTNNPDFPAKYYNALITELTYWISHKGGNDVNERLLLKQDKKEEFRDALSDNNQGGDLSIGIDRSSRPRRVS